MQHLMTGMSQVDPNLWMVTLPVVLAVVAVAVQPSESRVKRWWGQLMQAEAAAWGQLTGREPRDEAWPNWRSGLLCSATTALAIGTLISMANFVGLTG